MAQFTAVPTRHLAEFARILQPERDKEHREMSIAQLLHSLRARFDQDEKDISASLLHYQDAVAELQSQKSRVQFALPYDDTEGDPEQRKHAVYPATPPRPDPETLARLMEVSYTEWSESIYEDTTGESKLAEWLASFANKDLDPLAPEACRLNRPSLPTKGNVAADSSLAVSSAESSLEPLDHFFLPPFATPNKMLPPKSYNPNPSADFEGTRRRRALSDPPTPSKRETPQPHIRSRSTSHNTILQHKERVGHLARCENGYAGDSLRANSVPKSPAFSPYSPRFEEHPETTDLSPSIASPPLTPSTPNSDLSPLHLIRPSIPETPLRNLSPLDHSDVEDGPHQIALDANGLADLSRVHAFNLSLQHTVKSPFLIRTWRRMLGELANRFPLSSSDHTGSRPLIESGEDPAQSELEASLASEVQKRELAPRHSLQGITDFATVGVSPMGDDGPRNKTHADVLLDREYATYLRGSISAKQKEVRCLRELIAQREKTIERMEFVLKRRALEALASRQI